MYDPGDESVNEIVYGDLNSPLNDNNIDQFSDDNSETFNDINNFNAKLKRHLRRYSPYENDQQNKKKSKMCDNNKYGVLLNNVNLDLMDTDQTPISPPNNTNSSPTTPNHNVDNSTQRQQKAVKPPPIIITSKVSDFTKFQKSINEITNGDYRIEYTSNNIKVYVSKMETFDALTNDLKTAPNMEFYNHAPKNEKLNKLVIKAAPCMDPAEITNELKRSNVETVDCIQLKSRKKDTSSSYLVSFNKTTSFNSVKKIDAIDHVKIKWEKYYKKNKVTQCHRCQQFGHGSKYCFRQPRCVKCVDCHLTSECKIKKPGDGQVQCTNCKQNHTANFSGCPVYLKYLETIESSKFNINNTKANQHGNINTTNNTFTSKFTQPGISYANVAKTQSQNTVNTNPITNCNLNTDPNLTSFNDLITELNKLNKLCNLNQMFQMVRELNVNLSKCTDNVQRLMVFHTISQKYT